MKSRAKRLREKHAILAKYIKRKRIVHRWSLTSLPWYPITDEEAKHEELRFVQTTDSRRAIGSLAAYFALYAMR